MDARFMQMHNFVLTREIIINSIFPVDRMRELNFHRETAVQILILIPDFLLNVVCPRSVGS